MVFDEGPSFEEPGQPYQQDFTVSWTGLVSRTFTLWTRKIGHYIILCGIPVIIYAAIEFLVLYTFMGVYAIDYLGTISTDSLSLILNLFILTGDMTILMIMVSLILVSMIVSAFAAGATYKFAFDNYGSRDSGDVRESFSFTIQKIVPLILMQLIVSAIVIALMLPGLILSIGAMTTYNISTLLMGMGALMIGMLLAMYLSIRLSVAVAIVITEDHSVTDSLKRAFELTSGQFWHIFTGQMLLGIVVGIIGMVMVFVSLPLALLFVGSTIGILLVIVVVGVITQLLFSPLSYIFNIVLYRDLESRTSSSAREWW